MSYSEHNHQHPKYVICNQSNTSPCPKSSEIFSTNNHFGFAINLHLNRRALGPSPYDRSKNSYRSLPHHPSTNVKSNSSAPSVGVKRNPQVELDSHRFQKIATPIMVTSQDAVRFFSGQDGSPVTLQKNR